ncbi:hypothetical protein [Coleofasciculus sp. LEGE 07081]|uniref:hypothetical protein n=1 Tax=Coleofasciculus sp. LEGE 07081 TaxID=2777967 RepID=UPI002AD2C44F|nr:hypothetical protein [Coleofasciculus sp. LEGE 07081]
MMERTDHHFRYFIPQTTHTTLLYTERVRQGVGNGTVPHVSENRYISSIHHLNFIQLRDRNISAC